MNKLELFLFGTPRLQYVGQAIPIGRRKALALAAYLALTDSVQSRESLAAFLWPEFDQDRARSSLRAALSMLTRAVPVPWIQANRTTIRLNQNHVWVDARHFTDQLKQHLPSQQMEEPLTPGAVQHLRAALDLFRADFLAGFHLPDCLEFDQWQGIQQERLQRELGMALRRLAEHESGVGNVDAALDYARRWLALDPLHEPAHRLLMRGYAANGQRAEALKQYQQCAKILNAELLTPPEDETTDLYNRILDNRISRRPEEATPSLTPSSVLPPLPGLVVGREMALNEIKRRLGVNTGETRSTTVIQGWPGVGKSTTVATLAHDSQVSQHFPDGVLWTSLGETPNLQMALTAWAEVYRLVDPGRPSRIEELSTVLTAALRDKRVLLIVDDIWQVEHARPFRVGGQACAMVMTTRLNDVASSLAPTAADIYRLPVLAETAALELLGKLAPEAVADHPEAALELVRDLEGLPLAINVAGKLLHTEAQLGWGITNLLEELRGASLLLAPAPSDMIGIGQDTTPTIAALLKRSTDTLDATTRERFALLSLFVPKPAAFDLQAIAVAWDSPDPRPTIRFLINRGLLEPISGGRFQIHALLVLHARSLLQEMTDL
jgi:DNA-binding SARP family transcriptional activator